MARSVENANVERPVAGLARVTADAGAAPPGGWRSKPRVRALVGHPRLLAGCLLRSLVIWACIRLFAAIGVYLGFGVDLDGAAATVGLALVVVALVLIDARVTRELLFLRNLGLSAGWLVGWTAATIVALQMLAGAIP